MNSKLPRLNCGSSPAPAILTFMGIVLRNKRLLKNPESIAKKELLFAKAGTKFQDFVKSKIPGFAQDNQKHLTNKKLKQCQKTFVVFHHSRKQSRYILLILTLIIAKQHKRWFEFLPLSLHLLFPRQAPIPPLHFLALNFP